MTDGIRVERDDYSAEFFDATREGRFLIRRCGTCGRFWPPAQLRCSDGAVLEWSQASGRAALVTWTLDSGASTASELACEGDEVGEVIGIVELDEGLWLHTAIPQVRMDALRVGLPMRVEFRVLGGGEAVPVFVPS